MEEQNKVHNDIIFFAFLTMWRKANSMIEFGTFCTSLFAIQLNVVVRLQAKCLLWSGLKATTLLTSEAGSNARLGLRLREQKSSVFIKYPCVWDIY